jgi:ABC-type branched-subunit amino acid transport system substrate-binding protein
MNRKRIVALSAAGLILMTAPLFTSCRNGKASNRVTIGAVLLLSGDNALWGQNARRALDLLSEQLNKQGGIGGHPLTIVYEDSRGDPSTAVSAFQKLTTVNHVPAVLGDMLSSTTLAMAPQANEDRTVLIGISCSSPAVTDAGPYVYRVWPSDLYEGKAFAEWVHQSGLRSISIAYINNEYGTGLRDAFAKQFIASGGKITTSEGYNQAQDEARTLAVKLLSASSDGVYIVGYYEDTALMIRALRQAGYKGMLLGTSSSINEKLIKISGSGAEGFTAALVNDFDKSHLTLKQSQFLAAYKARYGEEPDWAATHAGDAFEVTVKCLKDGAFSGDQIKACIDKRREFDGIDLGVVFDGNGDILNKPIAVDVIRNGQFVNVSTIR